ncbi:unnamed protein product [Orchesella dallaii]|uniref:F-box domain-containing protein n=1 Tax=Orchesella dallaii TaxID=48710 RepID=A0ABP1Q050_9HEXA
MSNVKKSRSEADLEEVAMDEVCHFDKLPNEILELIFKHLLKLTTKKDDDSNQKSKFSKVKNKPSDLNCRLVNSRWKSGMERVLEKNALFLWKKMSIPVFHGNLEAEPSYLGYLFVKKEELSPAKMIFLSPPLESWGEENGNPFPSGSLKITSKLGKTRSVELTKDYQPTLCELVPFFTKFGHHLTSLIFQSVTLSPETLIGILNNTPNLKALNLIRVLFCMDVSHCPELPALQNLHHVRLVQVKTVADNKEPQGAHWYERDGEYFLMHENDNNDDRKQLYNWILSPYKEQLLTLDIFAGGVGTASNFAKLERLVITYADELTCLQPNVILYPRLKSLLLTDVQVTYDEDRMEWLRRNIAPFAETLSELYVDFPRRIGGEWLIAQPLFQLNPKSAQRKTKNIVFREMKTLVVPFPMYPQEMQVIKDLMKEFPNLETLMFLVRCWEYKVRTADAHMVLGEDYEKVCPKCKNLGIIRFL